MNNEPISELIKATERQLELEERKLSELKTPYDAQRRVWETVRDALLALKGQLPVGKSGGVAADERRPVRKRKHGKPTVTADQVRHVAATFAVPFTEEEFETALKSFAEDHGLSRLGLHKTKGALMRVWQRDSSGRFLPIE